MTAWSRPPAERGCGYRGYRASRPLVRRGPTRFDVLRAVPHQSRRLRTPRIERLYLTAIGAHPEVTAMRADARANLLEVAKWLARTADYETGITYPTRQLVCERAGIGLSTWKSCRRRLERLGFLGLVSAGCKRWRPEGETRNDAAVYVLCVPRLKPGSKSGIPVLPGSRPPTRPRRGLVLVPARAARSERKSPPSGRAHLKGGRHAAEWLSACADGGRAVAGALRLGPGQTLTDGWVGYLARPFVQAGWIAGDLRHAVDHQPDGQQHRYPVRDVRHAAAWVAWRLSHWVGPDGKPVPSLSQRRAGARARLREEQARRHAAWEQAEAFRAGRMPDEARAILKQAGLLGPSSGRPGTRPAGTRERNHP